jgi:hypothetical protein
MRLATQLHGTKQVGDALRRLQTRCNLQLATLKRLFWPDSSKKSDKKSDKKSKYGLRIAVNRAAKIHVFKGMLCTGTKGCVFWAQGGNALHKIEKLPPPTSHGPSKRLSRKLRNTSNFRKCIVSTLCNSCVFSSVPKGSDIPTSVRQSLYLSITCSCG